MSSCLLILNASSPSDIEGAFATLVEQQAVALLVGADTFFVGRRDELVALAARYRIPTSYFRREFAEAGGLISYAATAVEAFRQSGVYVGRILKGENPRDLPVEQSTKFELITNMKTAKALGLTIPPGVLSIADEQRAASPLSAGGRTPGLDRRGGSALAESQSHRPRTRLPTSSSSDASEPPLHAARSTRPRP